MKQLTLLLPLLLAACGTPEVQTRYVPVYCVTPEQYVKLKEAEPAKVGGQLTGNAQKDFKVVAGSNVALRMYAGGLMTVLGNCIGPAQ